MKNQESVFIIYNPATHCHCSRVWVCACVYSRRHDCCQPNWSLIWGSHSQTCQTVTVNSRDVKFGKIFISGKRYFVQDRLRGEQRNAQQQQQHDHICMRLANASACLCVAGLNWSTVRGRHTKFTFSGWVVFFLSFPFTISYLTSRM